MQDEEFLALLLAMRSHRDTTGFNFFDLLHAEGSPRLALFYSRLFWPEFVEIDEMILLKETIEDETDRYRLSKTLERYGGDLRKTEQAFNVVEVPSLFGKNLAEANDEEDYLLAERLAEMWRHRLHAAYPKREFTVKVLSEEETGGEVGIIFYQNRGKSGPE